VPVPSHSSDGWLASKVVTGRRHHWPTKPSTPYEVLVGKNPARIASRTERRAHQFVILEPAAPTGIVGRMEDGNPAHLIWIP
jgi:hypothetical protein